MPRMSGIEVQEELLRRGARFPVVLYTAGDTPELRSRAIGNGACAFLRKPFEADELVAVVADAVAGVHGKG